MISFKLNKVGFHSLKVWGGATFAMFPQVALSFLKQEIRD